MNFLRNQLQMFAAVKYFKIMRNFFVQFLLLLFSMQSFSQNIKLEKINETGLGGKKPSAQIKSNIFNDFAWTEPAYNAQKIEFVGNLYYFEMNGLSFQLTIVDSNMIEVKGNGSSMLMNKEVSKNGIYFDKKNLALKSVEKQKWIAHLIPESKVFSVKHLTPGSKVNYYTSFEPHTIVSTKWKWENTNDSILDIPCYVYYQFDLNDGRTLFIYEIKDSNGKRSYFIQNASYLIANDADGLEYILLDNNCNGNYTDDSDKIFFKSWNPNVKNSSFKRINFAKENCWYDHSFFNENFLIPYFQNGRLNFENVVDNYFGNNKIGKLRFKNIPKKSTLVINNKEYDIHKGKNKFDCEYGIYKAIISCNGSVDFETIFTLNENNPEEEITYKKTAPAGILQINNIFLSNYFVTVKNSNGFQKTYLNTTKIAVPTGTNEVTIYFDGYQINHQFSINQNEIFEFDFENEIKKLTN